MQEPAGELNWGSPCAGDESTEGKDGAHCRVCEEVWAGSGLGLSRFWDGVEVFGAEAEQVFELRRFWG